MNKFIIAAAATLIAGAATAQDAFITQIGDSNAGANVSENNFAGVGQQVIVQQGDNLGAANLAYGGGNSAWVWQDNSNPALSGNGSRTSLIWQYSGVNDGSGSQPAGNTAVHVQVNSDRRRSISQQTVQDGSENVAINWHETKQNNNIIGRPSLTLTAPSLSTSPNIASISPNSLSINTGTAGASLGATFPAQLN